MQGRICQIDETLLQRTAGPYIRVRSVGAMRLSRADHVRCCRRPDLPASRLSGGSRVFMSVATPGIIRRDQLDMLRCNPRVFRGSGKLRCWHSFPHPPSPRNCQRVPSRFRGGLGTSFSFEREWPLVRWTAPSSKNTWLKLNGTSSKPRSASHVSARSLQTLNAMGIGQRRHAACWRPSRDCSPCTSPTANGSGESLADPAG
jgi:hypothetical protein